MVSQNNLKLIQSSYLKHELKVETMLKNFEEIVLHFTESCCPKVKNLKNKLTVPNFHKIIENYYLKIERENCTVELKDDFPRKHTLKST